MVYIFVAVFLVLLIMNIIMSFLLKQMAASTGKQIERDALRLFTVYEDLLEEKSQKLQKLQEEIGRCEEKQQMENRSRETSVSSGHSSAIGKATIITGSYQDPHFADTYREIKAAFHTERSKVTGIIEEFQKQKPDKDYKNLVSICTKFGSEELYEASTLNIEEQAELLSAVLSKEEEQIYLDFCSKYGQIELSEFIAWADARRKQLDSSITVIAGDEKLLELLSSIPGLKLKRDSGICDGFRILQGTRMYDYSI